MKYDYDVIVLGGGAAGLVAATGSASLGAKTALIEKNKLGGDCTWYGCIPSKSLLKSAQIFSLLRRVKDFGITSEQDVRYTPIEVMAHVRQIIDKISTHHPSELFEKRGIKVLFGSPKFVNNRTIELEGHKFTSKRFIICTGSHPLIPPIEGFGNVSYLTNENIFDLEVLPKSLAVLGGGPIGVELSQAFSRLGVEVSLIEMVERLLFKEDEEVAKVLTDKLIEEGIKIYTGKKAVEFSKEGNLVAITIEDKNNNLSAVKAQEVLIAVGRAANVQGLDLEKAGIKYTHKGIEADMTLRTTASNIYVAGDVVGPYQFSHMAEYQAIIAVANALFPFRRKVNYNAVPWCTFSEPELAHVGLTEEEARAQYKNIKVYRSSYSANDKAVTDLEEAGLVKVICDKNEKILGSHIVGANAGELIHEFVLAMSSGLSISKISSAIHIYPTLSQINKGVADQHYFELLKSNWFTFFSKLMLKFLR